MNSSASTPLRIRLRPHELSTRCSRRTQTCQPPIAACTRTASLVRLFRLALLAGLIWWTQIVTASTSTFTLVLEPQLSTIAIHCYVPGGNTLNNLFPSVPENSVISKFANNNYVYASYQNGVWTPNFTLVPGEGAFFSNSGPALTLTLSGEAAVGGWPVPLIQDKTQLISRPEALPGGFMPADGWPAAEFDQILMFDPISQSYLTPLDYYEGAWHDGNSGDVVIPVVQPGDAVFYTRAGPTISPCLLSIVRQPNDVIVRPPCCGSRTNCAMFDVVAVGSGPIEYQWFSNGNSIPGATGAVYSVCSTNLQDAGDAFFVRLSNSCQVLTSAVARLTLSPAAIPPVVTPPSNVVVECESAIPVPTPQSIAAVDACGAPVPVQHVDDASFGVCPRTILRTYRATDSCSNSTTITQTITVHDTVPPVVSCPANVTVTAGEGQVGAVAEFATGTAMDNCDGALSVEMSADPGFFTIGMTTVTGLARDGCGNVGTCSFTVTVLPPPAKAVGLCSFTQGFYGNANGKFNGVTSQMLMEQLLGSGPLVVGKPGVRSLSVQPQDGDLLRLRLPAGGTPSALSSSGDQTLANASTSLNRKGRFDNVFLGQTLTLSLNLRLSPGLADVGVAPSFCTRAVLAGPDGFKGTADDGLESGGALTFTIPNSVRAALASGTLGIQDATVRGLLELANRALAGLPTGGATVSEINDAVDSINRGFDECRQLVDCATGMPIDDAFNDGFEDRPVLRIPETAAGPGAGMGGNGNVGNIRVRVSNYRATRQPGEPEHAGNSGGKSVWWRWTCPRTGPVLLTTTGSSVDTLLGVYTGPSLANLTLVASNDDGDDGTTPMAELIFQGVAGTEYQIVVDSYDRGVGTIVLSLVIDRPRLGEPALGSENRVAIPVDGPLDWLYTVEGSTDLRRWQPLGTMRNDDGILRFPDQARRNERYRFYRAELQFR